MKRYYRFVTRVLLCASATAAAGCRYADVSGTNTASLEGRTESSGFASDFATQLERFVSEVREMFNEKGSEPALMEYKTHFKVVYTDGRTFFSYRAEHFIDNGLWLHGGETIRVGTIDVASGRRLTTADVIPADKRADALAKVRSAVVAKIGGEDNLMPSAEETLAALPENFYVGEDGLHFIFAEYSVAPYHYAPDMYGPVEVVIPGYGMLR